MSNHPKYHKHGLYALFYTGFIALLSTSRYIARFWPMHLSFTLSTHVVEAANALAHICIPMGLMVLKLGCGQVHCYLEAAESNCTFDGQKPGIFLPIKGSIMCEITGEWEITPSLFIYSWRNIRLLQNLKESWLVPLNIWLQNALEVYHLQKTLMSLVWVHVNSNSEQQQLWARGQSFGSVP